MSAALPTPPARSSLISRVVDYEPPPVGATRCKATPSLRRRSPRLQRAATRVRFAEPPPPRDAVVFADAALRRVLEVIDRRRPVSQLRSVLAPALIDTVTALARSAHTSAARLSRVRVRMVDDVDIGPLSVCADAPQAEVFGTYTRGPRVHAIAARIARSGGRWRIDALQLG